AGGAGGHLRLGGRRRGAAERREEHCDERHERDREENCEAAEAPLALQLPASGRTGTPVGHRSRHPGEGSDLLLCFQRERAVDGPRPVDVRRAKPDDGGCSIGPVSAVGRPPRLVVPRWVQLVALPLLALLAWVLLSAASHIVFLFVVAALVALLLDPLVIALQKVRLPRGVSVALVYLLFAAALGLIIAAIATAVIGETKTAATRFNDYFTHRHALTGQTSADQDVDRLQHWLN